MKLRLKALLVLVSLFLTAPNAFASSGPISLNMDVPAGQWKAARLKNLPKDAVVAVQIESNGGHPRRPSGFDRPGEAGHLQAPFCGAG
jgi:hypothetical protein